MSVSVMIGEVVPSRETDACGSLEIQAALVEAAPNFPGQHQAGRNLVAMSTVGFAALCKSRTVADLLGAEVSSGALPADGSNLIELKVEHLAKVRTAVRCNPTQGAPGFAQGYDATMARLLLLEFWIAWALGTCKRPAMLAY